ncbi:hypothetical protein [Candidatus Phytoplasma prunorum]|uniref:hypothetical protein n=1 Tax=Candidatus Phytoplasma prunorum TaxID=47565 RepID=UPI002FF24473
MMIYKENKEDKKNIFSLNIIQIIILCIYIILRVTLKLFLKTENEISDYPFIYNYISLILESLWIYLWETAYNGNEIFQKNKYSIMQLEIQKQKLYENLKNLQQKETLLLINKNKK